MTDRHWIARSLPLWLVLWVLPGAAQTPAPEVAQELAALRAQVEALLQRIAELERQVGVADLPTAKDQPGLDELLNPETPVGGDVEAGVTTGAAGFNPDISVVGEVIGTAGGKNPLYGVERHNVLNRHIELGFSQRVAPSARAVVKLAYDGGAGHLEEVAGRRRQDDEEEHDEHGHEHGEGVELEEGYLQFDRLVPRMQFRVGRERVPLLTYNLLDGHELPSINRPLSVQRFFSDHGLVEDGIRWSYLLPGRTYTNFDLAVYSGRNETAFDGNASGDFAYFGRLNGFLDWAEGRQELAWSAGALFGPHRDNLDATVYGAELGYQWLPSQFERWTARAGALWGKVKGGDYRQGYHLHLAHRWDRYAIHEVGVLFDHSESLLRGIDDPVDSISVYYSRALTERIRPQIEYVHTFQNGRPDTDGLFFRLSYAMGTHPAHD